MTTLESALHEAQIPQWSGLSSVAIIPGNEIFSNYPFYIKISTRMATDFLHSVYQHAVCIAIKTTC